VHIQSCAGCAVNICLSQRKQWTLYPIGTRSYLHITSLEHWETTPRLAYSFGEGKEWTDRNQQDSRKVGQFGNRCIEIRRVSDSRVRFYDSVRYWCTQMTCLRPSSMTDKLRKGPRR